MRKFAVLLSTLVACVCAGCGDDPNDRLVSDTISKLKDAISNYDQITKIVSDEVAQANKLDPKHLAADKIALAVPDAEKLKKNAQYLQQIKAQTELRKESITPEQREEYSKKHKAFFQTAMADMDIARKKLATSLREADAIAEATPDAVEKAKAITALGKLREKLKEAEDEFEVLTKRQT